MTFILTQKTIDDSKEDYEYLRETLEEVADEINFSWWNWKWFYDDDHPWFYDQRVSYSVDPNCLSWNPDKGVEIEITFRKKDLEKHPTKYGLDFRNACLKIALRIANEKLDQNREIIIIQIMEDRDNLERYVYERRNAVGNP